MEATDKLELYLAGPMTGIRAFNFPAFDDAALYLRLLGHTIHSPAEMDDPEVREAALASPDGAPGTGSPNGETWGDFLARDVQLVADPKVSGVAVIDGWEDSRGANLELRVAVSLGKPVYTVNRGAYVPGEPLGLVELDPEYVLANLNREDRPERAVDTPSLQRITDGEDIDPACASCADGTPPAEGCCLNEPMEDARAIHDDGVMSVDEAREALAISPEEWAACSAGPPAFHVAPPKATVNVAPGLMRDRVDVATWARRTASRFGLHLTPGPSDHFDHHNGASVLQRAIRESAHPIHNGCEQLAADHKPQGIVHPGTVADEERVTNATTGGQKGRKPQRMDLLPWDVLMDDVAPLYAAGARKYDDHNWRKGFEWSLSYAAMIRHAAQFWSGDDLDAETQCKHLASVVFHACTLMYFMEAFPELDDRPVIA